MKRLLAYLFIVLGLGFTFSVNVKANLTVYDPNNLKDDHVLCLIKHTKGDAYSYFPVDKSEIYKLQNSKYNWQKILGPTNVKFPLTTQEKKELKFCDFKIYKSKYYDTYFDLKRLWEGSGGFKGLNVISNKTLSKFVDKKLYAKIIKDNQNQTAKQEPSQTKGNAVDQLKKLSDLYKSGAFSKAEFDKIKNKILAESVKKKKIVKKEITNVSNSRKINKIIKIDNKELIKENISLWEKNVLAAKESEKNDPYCEVIDKVTLKIFMSNKKKNYCIKKSDLLRLGEFKKLDLPNFIMNEIKGCQTNVCIGQHAGKKVYELFVRRGPIYHARYPGKMINGMVWFEILYYEKFRKLQRILKRYEENNYGNTVFKKANHEKQIYSLIKLNKARIKMRKALGFTLYDNTIEVIESQWLLAEFLNKDKLKVSRVIMSPEMHKRKLLIEKYKTVLAKYKTKLNEEKNRKIK